MNTAETNIRHVEPDDYKALHRVMTSPKAAADTLQLPLQSKESWRRKLAEPPGLYSPVACIEGEVVGSASLATFPNRPRMRHVGDLGITVRDDWRGKDVGSRLMKALLDLADNWLGLTRLELQVYVDNEAAIALYKKFGFEAEKTLRHHAFRDGKYVDAYSMARPSSR